MLHAEQTPEQTQPSQGRALGAIMSAIAALLAVCGGCSWAIFMLQPFGDRAWTFAPVCLLLAALALGARRTKRAARAALRNGVIFGRSFGLAGGVLICTLICWLGLLGWSSLSPGGTTPPSKSDPGAIRVLTWNILYGAEHGMPWRGRGWSIRRRALQAALDATMPDILCVQEALEGQVRDIAAMLPGHGHVGAGRDDGRSAGEQCAIFFDRERFEELDGGTFWLEEPADLPPSRTTFGPKRICTWVRLRDRASGRRFRVYNTHLYLTERARLRAVAIIQARIAEGEPTDGVLLAGDFNSIASAPNRRRLARAGLFSTAEFSGMTRIPTYHFYGIRLRSLDDVLVDRSWSILGRHVLDFKPANTFPSDHFGVMADLTWKDR
jgi:endonuclease/exonuclease/phosphatase family metal-dependent hydrolase